MTDHVRTGYSNHRKAAWGLALLVVAAIATVTIPLASGASKTLQFVTQPPVALQKSAPATTASVAVAVFSGGTAPVNSQGQTPSLSAAGAGTISDFVVSGPTYNSTTKHWTWQVTPKSSAPEGLYTFEATLGTLAPVTSNTFRVAQFVCPATGGPSCNATSNLNTGAQVKLNIANTLGSPIALDFQLGGAPAPEGCDNESAGDMWNRAFYLDANQNQVFFPAVALDFTWGDEMLQITYMIRNSEWTLTEATRGNQDIEFCAEARHQTSALNNGLHPFVGKYGLAQWDGANYSGVLTTVSNPSKVKTDGTGSPAICGRGNQSISGETWRTWTVCIPFDWDWGIKPG